MNNQPDFSSREFLLGLLEENKTVGQIKLAEKYGVSRRRVMNWLKEANSIKARDDFSGKSEKSEPTTTTPTEIDSNFAEAIYSSVQSKQETKLGLMKKHGLSRYMIDKICNIGMSLVNKKIKDKSNKPKDHVEQIAKGASTSGKEKFWSGMSGEEIQDLQAAVLNGDVTKVHVAEEYGVSRYQVDLFMNIKVAFDEKKEIESISVNMQEAGTLSGGTVFHEFKRSTYWICLGVKDNMMYRTRYNKDEFDVNTIFDNVEEFSVIEDEGEDSVPVFVVATDTVRLLTDIFGAAYAAEFCGIAVSDGNNLIVSQTSNFLCNGFNIETSTGNIHISNIDVRSTVNACDAIKRRFIEEENQEQQSYNARSVQPKKEVGYRVFVSSSQVQITEKSTADVRVMDSSSPLYAEICELVENGDVQSAFNRITQEVDIKEFIGEHVTWVAGDIPEHDEIKYQGVELPKIQGEKGTAIAGRFRAMAEENDLASMVVIERFICKLMQNPDEALRERILTIVSYGDVQFCEDGDLYMYKAVDGDFKDNYTHTLDNSVGSIVRMARNQIDPDPFATCTQGLHICSLDYINQMTGYSATTSKIVGVKVHPMNIVAVPADYGSRKIRCCEYLVVEDVTIKYQEGSIKADTIGFFSEVKQTSYM